MEGYCEALPSGGVVPFMVGPVARHERLGTGADFSELFPMDLRGLGTGAVFWRFVPHDFRCTNGYLGTGESFR